MKKAKAREQYCQKTWLNKSDSPSTGSVVAFDGEITWDGKKIRETFLSISDCRTLVRLHKSDNDTMDDFIDKMRLLRYEITSFIDHLEKTWK